MFPRNWKSHEQIAVRASQDGDLAAVKSDYKKCVQGVYISWVPGEINRTCEISDGTACSMRIFVVGWSYLYVFMREWC